MTSNRAAPLCALAAHLPWGNLTPLFILKPPFPLVTVKVGKITAIMKLTAPEEKVSNNQIVNQTLLQSNRVEWHLG